MRAECGNCADGEEGVRSPFLTSAKAVRFRHEQRVSRGDVDGEICHALMAKRAPPPSAPLEVLSFQLPLGLLLAPHVMAGARVVNASWWGHMRDDDHDSMTSS